MSNLNIECMGQINTSQDILKDLGVDEVIAEYVIKKAFHGLVILNNWLHNTHYCLVVL